MTKDQVKQLIVEAVTGPIKAVDLVLEVMQDAPINRAVSDSFGDYLDELVREGRLVEIEYVLPDMPERVKSVYFPAGTKVRTVHA